METKVIETSVGLSEELSDSSHRQMSRTRWKDEIIIGERLTKADFDINSYNEEFTSAAEYVISDLIRRKQVILNEGWDSPAIFHSRVVTISENMVNCDILVSENIIENRDFHIRLFRNFRKLEHGRGALIKIRLKDGSSRIDIIEAPRLVNQEVFDVLNRLDNLDPDVFGKMADESFF